MWIRISTTKDTGVSSSASPHLEFHGRPLLCREEGIFKILCNFVPNMGCVELFPDRKHVLPV